MKPILVTVTRVVYAVVVTALLAGCLGAPDAEVVLRDTPGDAAAPARDWITMDYQGRVRGDGVPAWAAAYLDGGERAVEALDAYRDRRVFVAENTGPNFTAIEQWRAGFAADLDFPRLAARRIERRFLAPLEGSPDDAYGGYFEALIRAASDAAWEGAAREDDFWILRRFLEGESGLGPAVYSVLVLVTVDRASFDGQAEALLREVKPRFAVSRGQRGAVGRVRERFWEGF